MLRHMRTVMTGRCCIDTWMMHSCRSFWQICKPGGYPSLPIRTGGFQIVQMDDFANVMLRTVLIHEEAENVDDAERLVDFLVTLGRRADVVRASGLPAIDDAALRDNVALRPIRLGPGLLVFLDRLKRRAFLRNWEASILQE